MNRIPSRRAFLKAGAAGIVGSVLAPDRLRSDPYAHLGLTTPGVRALPPVRVRGVVRAGGVGLPRVPVSDGLQVVDTGTDGSFEIVTTPDQEFVWFSLPSGFRVPVTPVGTARFHQRLTAEREQTAVFDLEPDSGSQEDHTLLLLGDIQTQNEEEMGWFLEQSVPDLQETVRAMGDSHVFGISCGDIMFDNLEMYPAYERGVQRVGVPFFQVVGNHDLDMHNPTDEGSTKTFSRHFGPRYYSFNRGAVHYVVLDDVFWHGSGYIGYLGADALSWLEQDLARVETGSPVIVATHIPVLGSQHRRRGESAPRTGLAVMNREALYRLLEPFAAHILTGHTHESEHLFEQGTHEHVTGAVCGAWWSGPICHDGTPNGYCVYRIRGEEVTWRYKTTGQARDHQMRIYPPGSDPAAPGEFLVNVWDWDPGWVVRWFSDGEPRGEMIRKTGLDPLSVKLHTGPALPPRRSWVEPVPTDHLFRAPVSRNEAAVVTVEVTNRFGHVYTREWRRESP